MVEWRKEFEEDDEVPEEYLEEVEEDPEEVPEKITLEAQGIERESWNEKIEDIDNRWIQEKEIERAKEIIEEEKELEQKHDSGEINEIGYEHEKLEVLGEKKNDFSHRCDIEAEGVTHDMLGDLSDRVGYLLAGELEVLDKLDRIDETIESRGPEASQELADRMLEGGRLSKKTYDIISRAVRMHRK